MAKRPLPLTRARRAHAERTGGITYYGRPLAYPAAPAVRYERLLDRAIKVMTTEAEKQVRGLWRDYGTVGLDGETFAMDASFASQARILTNAMAKRFQAFFDKLAPGLARGLVRQVDRASKSSLHSSLKEVSGGLSLKTSVIDGRIKELTKASVVENVGLIKSIPQQYFQKLQGDVMRSIQTDQGAATIMQAVEATGAVTKRRAKLIAVDQTRKLTTSLNSARMQNLGVKKFEWSHSQGGNEPRPLHKDTLNGQIFELANPPVIDDKTGEKGLPGQLINCRCTMIPVIDFGSNQ